MYHHNMQPFRQKPNPNPPGPLYIIIYGAANLGSTILKLIAIMRTVIVTTHMQAYHAYNIMTLYVLRVYACMHA